MAMKSVIICIILASSLFLIIDIIWLSISVKQLYRPLLGNLLNEKPVMWAALLFYLLYVFGLYILVLKPSLESESFFTAIWLGAVFGLISYGTYNLTNMATIKNWSSTVVMVDMIWGSSLTAFSSFISVYITKTFFN